MRNQAGNRLRQTRWRPLTSKRRCHAIFDKRKSPNTPFGTGEGLALAHLYNLCRWRRKCTSSSFPQAEGGTSTDRRRYRGVCKVYNSFRLCRLCQSTFHGVPLQTDRATLS
jgi:hypothetical protein